MGLSFNQLIMSLLLIIFGVLCYYAAPVSFLNQDIHTFLLILQALLICLILGLTFLASLFQPLLEGAIAWVLVKGIFRHDSKLYSLLKKNLESHRSRNLKSAIMFSLCLSFLMFAGTGFQIVGGSIVFSVQMLAGADLYASSVFDVDHLSDAPISEYLEQKVNEGTVVDFSFTTHPLCLELDYLEGDWLGECLIGPAAGNMAFQWEHAFASVPEKWFSTVMDEFYFPKEFDEQYLQELSNDGEKPNLLGGNPDPV